MYLDPVERSNADLSGRARLEQRDEATGEFLDRAYNVLCFGLPGRGKTHAAAALGHALVPRGVRARS